MKWDYQKLFQTISYTNVHAHSRALLNGGVIGEQQAGEDKKVPFDCHGVQSVSNYKIK